MDINRWEKNILAFFVRHQSWLEIFSVFYILLNILKELGYQFRVTFSIGQKNLQNKSANIKYNETKGNINLKNFHRIARTQISVSCFSREFVAYIRSSCKARKPDFPFTPLRTSTLTEFSWIPNPTYTRPTIVELNETGDPNCILVQTRYDLWIVVWQFDNAHSETFENRMNQRLHTVCASPCRLIVTLLRPSHHFWTHWAIFKWDRLSVAITLFLNHEENSCYEKIAMKHCQKLEDEINNCFVFAAMILVVLSLKNTWDISASNGTRWTWLLESFLPSFLWLVRLRNESGYLYISPKGTSTAIPALLILKVRRSSRNTSESFCFMKKCTKTRIIKYPLLQMPCIPWRALLCCSIPICMVKISVEKCRVPNSSKIFRS